MKLKNLKIIIQDKYNCKYNWDTIVLIIDLGIIILVNL